MANNKLKNTKNGGLIRRVSIESGDNTSVIHLKEKIKYGGPLAATYAMFNDFTKNSAVHGVKYLGERSRHWIERVFWIISFTISVVGCCIMINKIYNKWQSSPVIVSFAEKSTPVWQIPFPAVTICSETKVKRKFVNFKDIYMKLKREPLVDHKFDADEYKYFDALTQVCDPHLVVELKKELKSPLKPDEIVKILKYVGSPLNETTLFCRWRNIIDSCDEIFKEIITEEGICYTFNGMKADDLFRTEIIAKDFLNNDHNLSSENWTLEKGYSTKEFDVYPNRVLGPGARAGLHIVLKLFQNDFDYLCRGPVQGFKILLHTPGEIPSVSKQFFRVPMDQEVIVSVKPNMIETSETLFDYSPQERQCYFNHERNLQFFKVYTQSNCELECLANYTLTKCECVKFSMPRTESTKVCSQAKVKCYDDAEDDLTKAKLNKNGTLPDCECLPSCTSIIYEAEISQADFSFEKVSEAYNETDDEFTNASVSRLAIFFKERQFITSKRSELYGLSDFMANCGGLLGLFMGVSILSLIEIFYYLTLRLGFHMSYRMKKEKPAQPEDLVGLDGNIQS